MRRVKVRIHKGQVVEPANLPEQVEGWLTIPGEAEDLDAPNGSSDIWASYDPGKVQEALRQSAGALKGVDREQLLQNIHAAREQESRGRHD
jgi:hypothetical protein